MVHMGLELRWCESRDWILSPYALFYPKGLKKYPLIFSLLWRTNWDLSIQKRLKALKMCFLLYTHLRFFWMIEWSNIDFTRAYKFEESCKGPEWQESKISDNVHGILVGFDIALKKKMTFQFCFKKIKSNL